MPKSNKAYLLIVKAIDQGKLNEPFHRDDFRSTCPGLSEGTYRSFLYSRRLGNPGRRPELFKKVSPGMFRVVRPFKY